ncbi:MAG: guanylate kinase [Planctomycetota bacterium]|nr:MAG: guanylate kinase [Planctomycetota bacterium]
MSSEGFRRSGHLIIISGPSGSGKSTLWRRLVEHPWVTFSVSATTRAPRPGEQDGKDYFFLKEAEFEARMAQGEFLETAEVHGNHYGTLRRPVEQALANGLDVLLEIDVQGAGQIRASGLPTRSVFVMPPSMEVLEQRLRARRSESEAQVQRRLSIAAAEMAQSKDYDFLVINHEVESMVAEVMHFLGLSDSQEPVR